ncbi:MAG: polysaccharide deacetylase family protein, partial [Armatimonadota bacterium]
SHGVRFGDTVQVTSGQDTTEPLKCRARWVTPVIQRGDSLHYQPHLTDTGIGGVKYVSYGTHSGRVHGVRLAAATPVPPPGASGFKRVALTFDDGPSPVYTPQILEILARHNAHATFFTVGTFARTYPNIVQQVLDGGHEIGCHTWGHPDCTKLSSAEVESQLGRWKNACPAHQKAAVRWFRPPYGATDSRVRSICTNAGYRTILWTGDTADWTRPGADAIYQRALNAALDGACILMHDGGGPRNQTVAAVRKLVPELQRRGYQLVTLSELYGYEPAWNSDFLIQTEHGALRLSPADEQLQVSINGEIVTLPVHPVEIEGQLLLPARPTLDRLGCDVRFYKPEARLTLGTPSGTLQMHLNRCVMEVADREIWMAVPPVFFKGNCMIPLWVLLEYCGARAAYDPLHTTLHIHGKYAPDALSPAPVDNRYSLADDGSLAWHQRFSTVR